MKDRRKKEDKEQKDKLRQEQLKADLMKKKEEQDKAASDITGRLKAMLMKIGKNETPREYTFAGINLGV
jgi:hypothetical protein